MIHQILRVIRALLRFWYVVLLVPAIVAGVIFFMTQNRPSTFVSESTIMLNLPTNKGLSITNEEYKQHEIAIYFQNLTELLRSNKSLERVRLSILKDALTNSYHLSNRLKPLIGQDTTEVISRIDTLLQSKNMLNLNRDLDSFISAYLMDNGYTNESINNSFDFYRVGASNYMKLVVRKGNPFDAAYLSETLIQSLQDLHKTINKNRLLNDRAMFERLVKTAKQDLDLKVKELEDYKISNLIINLPEHTKAIVNQRLQLEMQRIKLTETIASRMHGAKQVRTQLATQGDIPSLDVSKNERFVEINERISELKSRQSGIGAEAGDEIAIIELQNELDELVAAFVKEAPIDLQATRQGLVQQYIDFQLDVQMTEQMLPLIEREIDRIQSYAETFAPFESNISTLEREIQTAQESYLLLLNKLNLAKTVEQGSGENELILIDEPAIPYFPEPSKRFILVVGAYIATFMFLTVIIGLIEYLDVGMWSVADVERHFGRRPDVELPALPNDEEEQHRLKPVFDEQIRILQYKIVQQTGLPSSQVGLLNAYEGEGVELLKSVLDKNNSSVSARAVPPYSQRSDWTTVIEEADAMIWVIHAGRAPQRMDHQLMKEINEQSNKPLFIVLNGVDPDYMDQMWMEMPKKRSKARRYIKQLLSFDFKQRPEFQS